MNITFDQLVLKLCNLSLNFVNMLIHDVDDFDYTLYISVTVYQ